MSVRVLMHGGPTSALGRAVGGSKRGSPIIMRGSYNPEKIETYKTYVGTFDAYKRRKINVMKGNVMNSKFQ